MDGDDRECARRWDDRVLIARIAAAERWAVPVTGRLRLSRRDTVSARKFEREADPDGALSAQERARQSDQLMQAHMLRISRAAAQARRRAAR